MNAQTNADNLRSSSRGGFEAAELIPIILAGIVAGLITVIMSVSFATLIFADPALSSFIPQAVALALLSAAVIAFIVSQFSSYPCTLAFPQDKIAPLLALLSAAIAAEMPGMAGTPRLYYTVIAALAISALAVGIFLFALGFFKLGALIRFIPYPVIGGFLAGTGFLLVKGAVGVMTGAKPAYATLGALFEPATLVKWAGGAVFAVALLLVSRKIKHILVMPVAIAAGAAAFYAMLFAKGISIEQAQQMGFLPGATPSGAGLKFETIAALQNADFGVVLARAGGIATILIISAVGVLLNASGLELAAKYDMDLNRELKVAGATNVIMGGISGLIGFHALSLSSLILKMGVRSRIVGFISAGMCAAMLFAGTGLLMYFPKALLGGLLFYLGLSFLTEWLYDGFRKLTRSDWIIIVIILLVVGGVGYLEGVAVGIFMCAAMFLVNYSRVKVIKHELSARFHRSNVDRPREHRHYLQEHGRKVCALKLQGFVFFGTANTLLEHVRARAVDPEWPNLSIFILDFSQVTGIDSSSVISFVKMTQFCEKRGMTLALTSMSPKVKNLLMKEFAPIMGKTVIEFDDLDHALEWAEDRILAEAGLIEPGAPPKAAPVSSIMPNDAEIETLKKYLKRSEIEAGETLFKMGDPSDSLYIIESGRLIVQMPAPDGHEVRLRALSGGSVVGEMGLYMRKARTATVVAETKCVVYALSRDSLDKMESENPAASSDFHQFMVHLMAERLANANKAVKNLLE